MEMESNLVGSYENEHLVTTKRGQVMTENKANELIGSVMKKYLNPEANNYIIYSVLQNYNIGIDLTPKVKVIPVLAHEKSYLAKRYEVIYNDDQLLFTFIVKQFNTSNYYNNTISNISYKLYINVQGLEIKTVDMLDFDDQDIKYMMNEFPYCFKTIKYILNFFIKELAITIGVKMKSKTIANDDVFFLDNAIDKKDQKMKDILHNIYASRIVGNFNK